MSSKKKSRKSRCPGCGTPSAEHSFGPASSHCDGPPSDESETTDKKTFRSSLQLQQEIHSTGNAEILHAIRELSQQVGSLKLDHDALRAQVDKKDGHPIATSSPRKDTTSSGNTSDSFNYVDLISLLPKTGLASKGAASGQDSKRQPETIESFDQWLEAWTIYEMQIMQLDPARYIELARYRSIIQKANRKFRWCSVYEYDVQFRQSLSDNSAAARFDSVDSTLYTTILDSSAVRKEGLLCQRCKSENHLVRDCSFRAKPTVEENKNQKKQGTGQTAENSWKFEKWYANDKEGCNLFQRRACQQGPDCKRAHVCKACRGGHPLADCKLANN